MKITINGAEKEVEIKNTYTRKVDREFSEIMFNGMTVTPQQLQTGSFQVSLENLQKANDYLIMQMTGLTQDELDEMTNEDYNALLSEIETKKIPSKK